MTSVKKPSDVMGEEEAVRVFDYHEISGAKPKAVGVEKEAENMEMPQLEEVVVEMAPLPEEEEGERPDFVVVEMPPLEELVEDVCPSFIIHYGLLEEWSWEMLVASVAPAFPIKTHEERRLEQRRQRRKRRAQKKMVWNPYRDVAGTLPTILELSDHNHGHQDILLSPVVPPPPSPSPSPSWLSGTLQANTIR